MLNFDEVIQATRGRCAEIIAALTPLPAQVAERRGADHPCPVCRGKTVIWPDAREGGTNEHGRIACRNCTDNKPTGDIIATVAAFNGIRQGEAARKIADYLGLDSNRAAVGEPDIIEAVAKAKRMPVDAFRRFRPQPARRGRGHIPVARVPVYNEAGEIHSHFDLTPSDKGFFKRGEGSAGLFFPGKLPGPGETWLLVEGVKDAAALVGLGFNACGLPGSFMAAKYGRLFRGVHVVTVADLDEAGQRGAIKTGGNLAGIAASVKSARLPGEIVRSGGDDVRDVLRRHGPDTIRDAVAAALPWKPSGDETDSDDRPEVVLTLRYQQHCDEVIRHLGRLGWARSDSIPLHKQEDQKLYQRGGLLVEVVEEVQADATTKGGRIAIAKGTPRIRPLPVEQLTLRIAEACRLVVEKEVDGDIKTFAVPPPMWLVRGIHTSGRFGEAIRPLEGIVTAPTIRVDGSILQTPGWDNQSGLLFRPSMDFESIPEHPTRQDASQAADKLLGVISDFPFQQDHKEADQRDSADRAAWVAMVLSMIGRPCIPGQIPMFAITANVRGAGKSLLVDAASIIAYGHSAARTTYASEDEEMRKRITAIAIEGTPAVLLDNIDRPIGGASLDAVLTAERWKDRELGQSRNIDLPMRTIWTATGNNLSFRSDVARRVLPIRLDSPLECPEDRIDFAHRDLLGWTRRNRGPLVTAALTMLRAYFVAGRPSQPDGQFGSFESWSEIVRGAVVWSSLADPLATRETAREDDQSAAVVAGLITGLIEFGGGTCGEIVNALNDPDNTDKFESLREIVAEVASRAGKPDARLLGNQLRKYLGRIATVKIDGDVPSRFRIKRETGRSRQRRWSAVGVCGDSGVSGSSPLTRESGCVSHTPACDTHTHAHGDGPEVDTPDTPHTPNRCSPRCDESAYEEVNCGDTITTRCGKCGRFIGRRPMETGHHNDCDPRSSAEPDSENPNGDETWKF